MAAATTAGEKYQRVDLGEERGVSWNPPSFASTPGQCFDAWPWPAQCFDAWDHAQERRCSEHCSQVDVISGGSALRTLMELRHAHIATGVVDSSLDVDLLATPGGFKLHRFLMGRA